MNTLLVVGWLLGLIGMSLMFVAAAKKSPPPERWMWGLVPFVAVLWPIACLVAMLVLIVEIVTEPNEEK